MQAEKRLPSISLNPYNNNNNNNRFGQIAEEDSEVSSDPESEKGVRIQLKKQEEEVKGQDEGAVKGGKAELSKMAVPKGDTEEVTKDYSEENEENEENDEPQNN